MICDHLMSLWNWKLRQKIFEADFDYLQFDIVLKQKHLFVFSSFEGLVMPFIAGENTASELPLIRIFSGQEEGLTCLDSEGSWLVTGGTAAIDLFDLGKSWILEHG